MANNISKFNREAIDLLKKEDADMVVIMVFSKNNRGSGCAVVAKTDRYNGDILASYMRKMAEAIESGELPTPVIFPGNPADGN